MPRRSKRRVGEWAEAWGRDGGIDSIRYLGMNGSSANGEVLLLLINDDCSCGNWSDEGGASVIYGYSFLVVPLMDIPLERICFTCRGEQVSAGVRCFRVLAFGL